MYGVITMSPNYEFMDYALSAFITTNIDIVEERLIIIMKKMLVSICGLQLLMQRLL